MSNDEYRAEQAERRQHGLKARHELRLERAHERPCDCDLARSEPLDHKPGPHHQASCPRWLPGFEELLAAPNEQFDKRSELLASIEAYSKAVPATASTAPQAKNREWLENATYTAAEVKVLTEAALRLGRKESGEEIAGAIEQTNNGYLISPIRAARIAREIGSQPSPDATSGRTDPGDPNG